MLVLTSDPPRSQSGSLRITWVDEEPVGPPAPGRVLVRVERAALNRVDLLLEAGDIPSVPGHVLGAESAGSVLQVGDGVEGLLPGQRVAVFPYGGCGECGHCGDGNVTMCRQARLVGVNSPGMYRSVIDVAAADVLPVASGVSADLASIATTLAVAWHVLVCRGGLSAGETVAVAPITSGLGMCCGAIAHHLGATVIGVGRGASLDALETRPAWLTETWAWDRDTEVAHRVPLAVDAAGPTIGFLHERLSSNGRMVSVGGHAGRTIAFDLWRLFTREQDLRGSHGCHREDMATVVGLLPVLADEGLVDSTFRPGDFAAAYDRLDRAGKLGKVLFDFEGHARG